MPVTTQASARPVAVRAAAIVYLLAAIANLSIGGYEVVHVLVDPGPVTTAVPTETVAVLAVITAGYTSALVWLTHAFYTGVSWARGTLVMVGAVSLAAAYGPGIIVTVLVAIAAVISGRPSVTRWIRALIAMRGR